MVYPRVHKETNANIRCFCRAYGGMGLGTSTINYSFSYFLPIILNQNLGFGAAASQILVAPPYGFAAIYMFGINYLGDKFKYRGPVIIFNMILCLIGLPILGWHSQPYVRYFGAFLICGGANANLPSVLALQGTNIRGQWKRAFCSALFVGLAGVGGIAGALVFRDQDKMTGYKPGLFACITAALLVMVLTLACDLSYYRDNKAADRGEKDLECDEVSYLFTTKYLSFLAGIMTNKHKIGCTPARLPVHSVKRVARI